MSVFISDKDTAKTYIQFFRPRMSWSIYEILKPFKITQSCVLINTQLWVFWTASKSHI